ncbi:MAG: PQQ-binding-like beta-propeller repeat protein [Roseomonas sp.]|nr:PQQ-binding-like beta-propeller repeat protein [Roseomonas sp.]
MTGREFSRRAWLLGSAGLLAGCETLDSIFGERRVKIVGERKPVLALPDRTVEADAEARGLTISLPAQQSLGLWPQLGGMPSHAGGHMTLGTNLRQAWSAGYGTGTSFRRRVVAGPVASADRVFMGDADGFVSAFDIANGARRWRVDTRPENERGDGGGVGVILDGDTVFVTTVLSEVLALSAADGAVKWRVRLQAPMRGAASIANGRIFVTTLDSTLVALSAEDGRVLWRYRAQAILTVPLGLPPPAVSGETVVAGFPSGEILAFRANDGRVIWSDSLAAAGGTSLADVGSVRAAPVISGNSVIAIGMGGVGVSIDLRAGRRIWEREFGGTEMPWAGGDWVFGVTDAGEVAALQRETGMARWAVSLRPPAQGNRARPLVQLSSPLLAGGRLFVGTSLAELVSVDPSSGDVLGRQRLPAALSLPMLVVGGRLIVATDDGSLIAFAGEG